MESAASGLAEPGELVGAWPRVSGRKGSDRQRDNAGLTLGGAGARELSQRGKERERLGKE